MSTTTNLPSAHDAHISPPPESKEASPSHNSPPSTARRTSYQMVGGILISNEEGVRWFEQTYGRELPKDHRTDASVRMELERILTEVEGEPLGVEYAPRRDTPWYDFLAATQLERGIWEHGNPDGIDEVSLPGQQMKGDSAREEQMRGILRKLGLQPGEFNSSHCVLFSVTWEPNSTGGDSKAPCRRATRTPAAVGMGMVVGWLAPRAGASAPASGCTGQEEREETIRRCGVSGDDGFSIACDACSRRCHAACFGIEEGSVLGVCARASCVYVDFKPREGGEEWEGGEWEWEREEAGER
ncbi:hypothetical protein B0H10DRAFT_1968129 [Mycena sp. CBHHK59/15]|nr:hypothetical protein B0H10DRAFT_1968129 [Mycena sp. CBHHK59/15]